MARSDRPLTARWRARTALAALVAVASALAFVGCNALVGLDGFDKVGCARDCDAAPDVPNVPDAGPDGSDASPDVVVPIPDGASPASWARWPMPNPPDGGGLLGTDFDYVTGGDGGVVTDRRTNLVWGLRAGAAQSNDFDAAIRYCDGYEPGVKWRLPTRIELVTLIDFTRTNPAIDTSHFPTDQVPAGWYWTSSVVRPPTLPYRFWAVDFATGAVSDSPPSGARNVLCVKGSG